MVSLSTYVNGKYKKKADKGVSQIHEHKTLGLPSIIIKMST